VLLAILLKQIFILHFLAVLSFPIFVFLQSTHFEMMPFLRNYALLLRQTLETVI